MAWGLYSPFLLVHPNLMGNPCPIGGGGQNWANCHPLVGVGLVTLHKVSNSPTRSIIYIGLVYGADPHV